MFDIGINQAIAIKNTNLMLMLATIFQSVILTLNTNSAINVVYLTLPDAMNGQRLDRHHKMQGRKDRVFHNDWHF